MENAQLTIADLASLHSLIDAACTRGAFKAGEMQAVGETYNKLTRFLEAAKAQAQAQAEQAQAQAQAQQVEVPSEPTPEQAPTQGDENA